MDMLPNEDISYIKFRDGKERRYVYEKNVKKIFESDGGWQFVGNDGNVVVNDSGSWNQKMLDIDGIWRTYHNNLKINQNAPQNIVDIFYQITEESKQMKWKQ